MQIYLQNTSIPLINKSYFLRERPSNVLIITPPKWFHQQHPDFVQ